MKAGKMRHRITIQTKSVAKGSAGGTVETLADLYTCYADIESIAGREYQGQGQVKSESTHKFWIWYDRTIGMITPKMLISFDSRLFDIESVVDRDERKVKLLIMAVERGDE